MGSNDVRATKDKTVVAAQSISELNDDSDPSCPYTFSLLAQQDDGNFRLSKIISQGSRFSQAFWEDLHLSPKILNVFIIIKNRDELVS